MRHYKVNNIQHTVFDSTDEVPSDIKYLADWRDGHVGDWVLADDGCVCQILREGTMLRPKGKVRKVRYIGTCTGTFATYKSTKFDTSRRINIYSIGGHSDPTAHFKEKNDLTSKEEMFVRYLTSGMDYRKAYLKAFPTKNLNYAKVRAGQLVKTSRIKTAMKEELKPVCEELGIDPKSVLQGIKLEADTADKSDTRLKALFKLSDILDLEDKNKTQVTQVTGALFQGFSKEELEEAKRPKEISYAYKQEEEEN